MAPKGLSERASLSVSGANAEGWGWTKRLVRIYGKHVHLWKRMLLYTRTWDEIRRVTLEKFRNEKVDQRRRDDKEWQTIGWEPKEHWTRTHTCFIMCNFLNYLWWLLPLVAAFSFSLKQCIEGMPEGGSEYFRVAGDQRTYSTHKHEFNDENSWKL